MGEGVKALDQRKNEGEFALRNFAARARSQGLAVSGS
jgi:hypothetical protein